MIQMQNTTTNELAPAHLIGTDEDGREVYCRADGWELVGAEYHLDEDGNYVIE